MPSSQPKKFVADQPGPTGSTGGADRPTSAATPSPSEGGFERRPDTAKRFFERAAEVAATGNYDYAIELYCHGLDWDPDAFDEGHRPMHEVAMRRKLGGGKPAGMFEKAKLKKQSRQFKNPALITSEYLLAKDPDNVLLIEAALRAADKLGLRRVARWLAVRMVEANRQAAKPSFDRYILATDILERAEAFEQAVGACQSALMMKPNDQALITRVKNLSAMQTIQRGKYETAESSKESMLDRERQMAQQADQAAVPTEETIDRQIAEARKELEAAPDQAGKIFALADVLLKRERQAEENEAVAILEQAYRRSNSYRFKQRIGDIRIRQFRRRSTELRAQLDADPGNAPLQQETQANLRQWLQFEEEEYRERVKNYPSDMALRYEFGRRLFANRKFDEAISVLQEAERDPKSRLAAISLLGQSFFHLKFYREAVDTFQRGINSLEIGGTDIGKELYYFKGRALEQMNKAAEADAAFSQVMQWDFNYKDVRQRLQRLREQPPAAPKA